jgi:hypothetical protein
MQNITAQVHQLIFPQLLHSILTLAFETSSNDA